MLHQGHSSLWLFCLRWLFALVLPTAIFAHAATTAPEPIPSRLQAYSKAHAAVVGIRVSVADGAASSETLGREREGSGVVIGKGGMILTIGYLMLEAQSIEIVTQDNKTLPAQAVAYDQATGFGLVKTILPLDIDPVGFGRLDDVDLGEALMAATGTQSQGSGGEVNMVHLVGKRPFSGYWEYHIEAAAFTSPPIANHSGAPLFNRRGEVIGIGSLLVSDAIGQNRRFPGNMFVPVDLLKPILAEMQQTGSTTTSHRPWIGISSVEQEGRIKIIRVSKQSPAQRAGLEPGDLVLAVDGHKVTTLEALYKKLWDRKDPDGEVSLTVLQGADLKTIRLQATDRMRGMRKASGI